MFEGKNVTVVLAPAGSGKCEWVEQIIPTPQGLKRFGDIKVGDYVYAVDGSPTKVLGVYPQGYKDVYKVTLSDGRSTECGLEHLWGVYTKDGNYKVLTVSDMLHTGVRQADKRKNRKLGYPKLYVPCSPVIDGKEKELPCDPYILGSFIGNGCCTLSYLTISSDDEWQVNKCADILGYTVRRNKSNYSWTFYGNEHMVRTEDVLPKSICCYAHEKRIPQEYLFSSVEQRKALIQGLFDTDGCVCTASGRLHISYSTVSEELCKDIQTLLLTFGITSSVYKDTRKSRITYELRLRCSKSKAELLFSLPRKVEKVSSFTRKIKRNYNRVPIKSIEKLSVQKEMMCIYVEDKQHLYLTKDFIVTHNTHYAMQVIEKELKNCLPTQVLFTTFTRKGVAEGIERVGKQFHLTKDDVPYFGTLHSLTFHALNYDLKDMWSLKHQSKFNKIFGYKLRTIGNNNDAIKSTETTYYDIYGIERLAQDKVHYGADMDFTAYNLFIKNYNAYKAKYGVKDFTDCLEDYIEKGESFPCKVAIIDEFQDISYLQLKVFERMAQNAEKIYLIGDPAQCIYSYSGSRPDYIIDFSHKYNTIKLERSYRLPNSVYRLARALTNYIGDVDVDFPPVHNVEGKVTRNVTVQSVIATLKEPYNKQEGVSWYFLARNNCHLTEFTSVLEENVIPYWTSEGFFMSQDVLHRMKMYLNFNKKGALTERQKQKFVEKYGITDCSKPFTETTLFGVREKYIYYAYYEKYGFDKLNEMATVWKPQIVVSTIHKVKGGEADNVVISTSITKSTYNNVMSSVTDELRVLYVGVTRAKKNLIFTQSESAYTYNPLLDNIIKDSCISF